MRSETKARMLVIDDEENIRKSLKMILEYEGYEFFVTFFQRSGNFDALVLALRSPGPYSRADAAGALGSLKDKRAIPYLVAATP